MYPGGTSAKWLFSSRKCHPEYCAGGYGYSGSALSEALHTEFGAFSEEEKAA
jgi:hypothetical protein